ncbi:LPS-assembly protein LptD [Sphingomonas lutea]|uniref:LPS-assembly protein LptD n=1 Tax=Sphingomonas lutea TaxID=1045317 RepID=A0A7G9SFU7_9SPHN|nr:LPS-assembly protein LptD [Sphingomonas lutea]QNN66722.1 LPS-assembly protein LptD [Sphingomonas lutea]
MRKSIAWWMGLPMLAVVPATVHAQEAPTVAQAADPAAEVVEFTADEVSYEGDAETITASGAVRMSRDGNYLAADRVTWNRQTGEVRAIGNVVVLTPEGIA